MPSSDKIASPPVTKRKQLESDAMKRIDEWIISQEISSDLTVQVGDVMFSLHKFHLSTKCGYIKNLLSESKYSNFPLQILDLPGGAEAFELVAKFCYGINFELTNKNIAMVRCAAEYLDMSDQLSVKNLIGIAETYFEEVVLASITSAVTVLQKSEDLLPTSEKVKLISRCTDAIAYLACLDNQSYLSNSMENLQSGPVVEWWVEELMILRIDTFRKVLMALESKGVKQYVLRPILMLYAQKSLRSLEIFGKYKKRMEPKEEHEKRVILETIVSLLPKERNAMSVSFLSMLLRASLCLETTVACRLDLEKRISMQLEQAVLDDLLIPSFSNNTDALFDVDTVQRILNNYLDDEFDGSQSDDGYVPPPPASMESVGKLMEDYLAEIASDQSLTISSFISIAELVPEQAKATEDGIYRAIDIYLKAHPVLTDMERKKVCSLMNCQKLSREACAHAAQNDRLPAQIVVQVLYHEQQRLRGSTNANSYMGGGGDSPALSDRSSSQAMNNSYQVEEISRLKKENDDLKLELVKARMQLRELQTKELQRPLGSAASPLPSGKPPLPKKSIMNSVSKKLGKLNPFIDVMKPKARTKPPKDRRHSIS